jgi:tryptophan-rich sensory protein
MHLRAYVTPVFWILAFEAVSFAIGISTQESVDGWYQNLQAPPLVPPDIVFPVVWTLLYVLIALAGWRLYSRRAEKDIKPLLALFAVYMVLNWSWSFVFFTAHQLLLGFAWIVCLDLIAFILIIKAWRIERPAAGLMIPPLLWTLFAAYLNGAYWWLNGS